MIGSTAIAAPPGAGEAAPQIEATKTLGQSPRPDHLFANNIRFLSMVAIIGLHTAANYPSLVQLGYIPPSILFVVQPMKFGTIAFFLVAGFLLGERIDKTTSVEYFNRRLRNVFVPWLFWFLLFCMGRPFKDLIHGRIAGSYWSHMFVRSWDLILNSVFWFVPNLLFALAILLLFRRKLDDVRLGLAFMLASLFYGVNIYGHWVPVLHYRAFFGFVFYLWLGAWCARHFGALEERLARIPAIVVIGLIFLTFTLALAESKLLLALGSIDPQNTLRISNQIYSVVVVLGILKIKRKFWPSIVDVRKDTYGLYLTHSFGLEAFIGVTRWILIRWANLSKWSESTVGFLLIPVIFFLTYAGCLVMVKALLSTPRLRWTVGLSR